jgi:hypothetical protein
LGNKLQGVCPKYGASGPHPAKPSESAQGVNKLKGNFFHELKEKFFRIARKSGLRLIFQTEALRIDHGPFSIELHAWRSAESCTFATFIYEKAGQRLLRHFTGSDENKVIRQARVWCDENS